MEIGGGDRAGTLVPYGALLSVFVERQARVRMKRAWFGLVWPVVAPLVLLALYAFVFRSVFQVPIRNYPIFLFSGLLPWTFLAQSLGQSMASLSGEHDLVCGARFPRELLPISSVVVLAAQFLVTLALFVVYLAVTRQLSLAILPMLVLPLVALVLFVTGLALMMALIDVYNRDLRHLLGNLLTVWFFLVPIVYTHEMVTGWPRILRSVDPMNLIVGEFRDILYWHHLSRPVHMVVMLVLSACSMAVSLAVFGHFSARLPKEA